MTWEHEGNITVAVPQMEIVDATNSSYFKNEIDAGRGNSPRIILDMQNVRFVDSTGLGKIVALVRELKESGGTVAICNVNNTVSVLFRMVKLNQIVRIYEDRASAVKGIG